MKRTGLSSRSRQTQPRTQSIDQNRQLGVWQQRGLKLQPEATPETLIRRLSFDLTGLPPSPEEISAFTAEHQFDPASSIQHLVTSLLASPHYGERMAVDWLDQARYADSFGFQVDREREVWPWRDWVVKAYNENLPFNQFITWQLAGDLLPNAHRRTDPRHRIQPPAPAGEAKAVAWKRSTASNTSLTACRPSPLLFLASLLSAHAATIISIDPDHPEGLLWPVLDAAKHRRSRACTPIFTPFPSQHRRS
jgi:hypothetical protein